MGRFFLTASVPFLLFSVLSIAGVSAEAQDRAQKSQEEWKKLDELGKSIAAQGYIGRNVESDLAAIRNLASYKTHLDELAKDFAKEIKEDNQPFRNLGIGIRFLRTRLEEFEREANEYGSLSSIKEDLDQAVVMAKRGVENNAPAYFRPENDIGIRLEKAKVRLQYFESLTSNPKEVSKAKSQLESTVKEIERLKTTLSSAILEQNTLPPDEYRGSDRDELLKLVQKKWEQEGNGKKPLKIGIVTANWTRNVAWEIQNRTLYKVDQSRIQAYVVADHNQKTVVRHSINLIKDHLSNDKIKLSFLDDPRREPELSDQILRQKLVK